MNNYIIEMFNMEVPPTTSNVSSKEMCGETTILLRLNTMFSNVVAMIFFSTWVIW